MAIKSKYKLYGIIGSALDHSLSPLIHNYLFKKYKLNNCYSTFESDESKLKDVVSGIKALNISGVNITFPYKQSLMPYLDKIDKTAEITGAVNTIKNHNNKLIGYNTDIIGIRKTIENKLKLNLKNKSVLLLGAGGASRACLVELINQKAKNIIIANRDIAKAKNLIKSCKLLNNSTEFVAININELNNLTKIVHEDKIDLLINSTSAKPAILTNIINKIAEQKYFEDAKIFDLNYGQRVIQNKQMNFTNKYIDGLYMLCAQAAAGFYIWTGINVEPDNIYKYVKRKITG